MIIRVLSIAVTGCALWALWFGYGQLKVFRGTALWEFRYIIFATCAFLGLSLLEWALSWIKNKLSDEQDSH